MLKEKLQKLFSSKWFGYTFLSAFVVLYCAYLCEEQCN